MHRHPDISDAETRARIADLHLTAHAVRNETLRRGGVTDALRSTTGAALVRLGTIILGDVQPADPEPAVAPE